MLVDVVKAGGEGNGPSDVAIGGASSVVMVDPSSRASPLPRDAASGAKPLLSLVAPPLGRAPGSTTLNWSLALGG